MKYVKKPRFDKICKECRALYKGIMARGEFCSGRCRVKYWAARKSDSTLLEEMVRNQWVLYNAGGQWHAYDANEDCIDCIGKGTTFREAILDAIKTTYPA